MTKNDSFTSDRLLYRGISEADTDYLVKWRSNLEIIRYFRNPEPVTIQSHIFWFNNSYLKDNHRFDFIIIKKFSEERIGTVSVNAIDYTTGSCEVSYMVAELNSRRKGFAKEAISAIMKKMQEEGISNFYAEIHQKNQSSINLIMDLGYSLYSQQENFLIYNFSNE